jgi:hypothetical protein
MLCIEFETPVISETYTQKRLAALVMLRQIVSRLDKCPELIEDSDPGDRDVVGLCNAAANQICHDMDLVTMLEW